MLQVQLKPNTLIKIVPKNVQLDGNPVTIPTDNFSFSVENTTGNLGTIQKDSDGDWAIQTGDAGAEGTITGNVSFEGATGTGQVGVTLHEDGQITFEIDFAPEGGAAAPDDDVPPAPPGD